MSPDQLIQFMEKQSLSIIQMPEKNYKRIQNLILLLESENFLIIQLSMLSLTQIFMDITP